MPCMPTIQLMLGTIRMFKPTFELSVLAGLSGTSFWFMDYGCIGLVVDSSFPFCSLVIGCI
ncbi:hypothetical protein LINPERHAP1_LOCUS1488 [Linum perenne]